MKSILLILFSFFCLGVVAQVKRNCLYISPNEAVIYDKINKGKPIKTLQQGDMVRVEAHTGQWGDKLNGRRINFEWLKVKYSNNPTDDENAITGYIPSVYLVPYLKKIPDKLLGAYNFIEFENGNIITANQTVYNYYYGFNEDPNTDTANCGCFAYNGYTESPMYSTNTKDEIVVIEPTYSQLDTLRFFLKIENADIKQYLNKKINNPLGIDTGAASIRWVEDTVVNTTRLVNKFYLYINNGKDSTLINEVEHEYGSAEAYAGQLIPYNKYLLSWVSFFYNGYTLVDKTTGVKTRFTDGRPYISPKGKFVVDFYESFDYEEEKMYGTILSVSSIDDSLYLKKHITIGFRSFVPLGDVFWVSDDELIIAVEPIDNFIYSQCVGVISETEPQYIKIKILADNFIKK